MEQICYGSFVWVIVFLPFWGSPSDPPLPQKPPANACTFESSTCRAAHQFFSPAGGDGAPQKKGCILDPILQDTVGPNASAKIDQPPAWCTHDFKAKRSKPWGPSRSAPAAECGLRTRSLHKDGESELRSPVRARVPPVTRLSNQVTILGPRCSAQSSAESIWWTAN